MNPNQLIAELRTLLPAAAVLTATEQQRPFECDGLSSHTGLPLVTLLPTTVAEVQAVMRLCHRLGVPVVCRGAGTGLSGGATPWAGGVLLVLSRLDQILSIDAPGLTAVVEPGVRNLAVSEAAAPWGLYYAPDPSSQIACSVGGNVAENAGGVHCLKYGLTVHNVLAVKLVTVSGELVEIGIDSDGPDLLALVIGSEGLLGVVVEVTVRLLVLPPAVDTLLAAFDSVEAASQAVSAVIGAGIIPAGLEMMDRLALTAAEDFAGAGYPRNAAAILLVELDGPASEVERDLEECQALLLASGASGVQVAADAEERALFWKGRKNAFPAVGRLYPDYYCMDGTIPRRSIGDVLGFISERSAHHDMPVANVFHAGDGNLHPLILFDANCEGELEKAELFGTEILEKCIAVGGTITGEHGVGREKIDQMASQFTDAELAQFRRIKAAFDPAGLLNPGKTIPTLKRCQEYRALRHEH
ncbi:FAD-linked oxidase C-terminal domain-containing protein [Candidatus Litorirhabdus singularis]|nr:FAD-linked oxidase C-terminal domain-containing protein [Candidatus Litorirhabdus singularis]